MKARHALIATALLAAAPAEAAQFIITYTGIAYGYDETGEFGVPHTAFEGVNFTAAYSLTAPLPGAILYDDGIHAYILGGLDHGAPSPVAATLTINGATQVFTGANTGIARQNNGWNGFGGVDYTTHGSYEYVFDDIAGNRYAKSIQNILASENNNFLSSQNYTSSLSYSQDSDWRWGGFEIRQHTNFGSNISRLAYADLFATSVTIAPVSGAVPEPATWAMMIAGFGMVGGAMRRRRRVEARVRFA